MQNTLFKRYHHLQPEERMTLANLVQQKYSACEIAKVIKRSTSSVAREIKRNAHNTGYSSQAAQTCAVQRRIQARVPKSLHDNGVLFGVVHCFLCIRWSPEQIAMTLAHTYPKGHELRVSHETIYNCIYAQPVGELKKDLIQALRHARNKRVPRSKGQDRRGHIPDMLSIHLRPPEIEVRLFPVHWGAI